MDPINSLAQNTQTLLSLSGSFLDIVGKKCCRQRVGEYKSLTLGFGEKIFHSRKKSIDPFSGEWEIGTYCSAWRIVKNEKIVCGSMDPVDSLNELDERLSSVEFGSVMGIKMLSKFDIRVELDNGISIEFLCATDYEEEVVFIFGPNNLYIQYSLNEGWQIGKSNEPWI
jgi:hypothetical protein